MFRYRSKSKPMFKQNNNVPTIHLDFWDELYKAQKHEWPVIVKKYGLDKDVEKLNYVAANREAVFGRMKKMEDDFRQMSERTTKWYAEKYGVKV